MLTCEVLEMNFVNPVQALENAQGTVLTDPAIAHARKLLADLGLDLDHVPERAGRSAQAALDWANSGAMALTGDASGPPQLAPGPLASAARGAGLVIEALTSETANASDTSSGPFAKRDWAALLGERAAIDGLIRNGQQSAGGAARLLETEDGWIALNLPRDDDWSLLPAWLASEGSSPPWVSPFGESGGYGDGDAEMTVAWEALAACVRKRRAEVLVERGRLMGLAVANAPRTLPESPAFRISFGSVGTPVPGGSDFPALRGPAPSSPRRLRILDLTSLWAGPLATSLLAEAGANVLKIEAPERPDGARGGSKAFFDLINAGKRGAALDLRDQGDRKVFEKLLAGADVVFESARPRGLKQLGYDAEEWVRARPGRLWTSITGYGRQHEWIAFGDDAAVAAGLAWPPKSGTHQDASPVSQSPYFCADAVADPLTGLHAAAIVLAHLKLGRGGLLDLALQDIAAYCAGPTASEDFASVVGTNQKGWTLKLEDGDHAIALPRARSSRGVAPKLGAPSKALLAQWTNGSC
jgi:hypothetical protein